MADQLGRMAALEATLAGMIHGQIEAFEGWPGGNDNYVTINRRYMYAALNWCTENHSMIIEMLRELMGGGVFQMPPMSASWKTTVYDRSSNSSGRHRLWKASTG